MSRLSLLCKQFCALGLSSLSWPCASPHIRAPHSVFSNRGFNLEWWDISFHQLPSMLSPWFFGSLCHHRPAPVSEPLYQWIAIRGFTMELRQSSSSNRWCGIILCHVSPCEWWHMLCYFGPLLPSRCWICIPHVHYTATSY